MITTHSKCRACGSPLEALLSLGNLVLSGFVTPDAPDPPRAPLDVVVCSSCQLVQLRHSVDPPQLFAGDYWYHSSINEVMRAELQDVAGAAVAAAGGLDASDWVLDVGANDGFLLRQYGHYARTLAVEPSKTFAAALMQVSDVFLSDFFPAATIGWPPHTIKILTSIACFYDANDPRSWVQEIDRLLTKDGVWICQFQDLGQQMKATAFDNFCHEHVCYYTLKTFSSLLQGFNLHVTKVEFRLINGGSLRLTIQRDHRPPKQDTLDYATFQEQALSWSMLEQFAWRIGQQRDHLQGAIAQALRSGPVDMLGASTKANTLLQYCGFDRSIIRQAVERSPEKVGLETASTRIPIVSEATWRAHPAPLTLLTIWQFRAAILQREAAYLDQGGCFLVPLPHTELLWQNRSTRSVPTVGMTT